MKKQFSIAEAKNGLPQIVHQAEEGCEIAITRRGAAGCGSCVI